jgi:hypothetical protein
MTDRVPAIRHGMFIMPFHPPTRPLAQCYDEDTAEANLGRHPGFSSCNVLAGGPGCLAWAFGGGGLSCPR